jgi:hypothetical protein
LRRLGSRGRVCEVAICGAGDPEHGRSAQYTLLDVPTILVDARFRRDVLARVSVPGIRTWWSDYFEGLDRRLQLEVSNPVQTKIHRFEGSTAARQIVGQAASTVDPAGWLREGAIVIVNTARGIVGENAAALIGSTLLNLATLAVAEQAHLEPDSRSPIGIVVDETKTMAGRIECEADGTWRRIRFGRAGASYSAYIGNPATQVQRKHLRRAPVSASAAAPPVPWNALWIEQTAAERFPPGNR